MKNDMKSRRVQAQRKFAQGAYIPPTLNNNVVAARADLAIQTSSSKEEKTTIYNNSSAKLLLDIVSFQGLHTHLQPVVLLKRLDNPKDSPPETQNGHDAEEKRPVIKETKIHAERIHIPAKKPKLATRTSTMCLRSRVTHNKQNRKVFKKKTRRASKLKKISSKNCIRTSKRVLETMSSTSEDERPLKYFKNDTNKKAASSPDRSEARKIQPKSPRRVKKRRESTAIPDTPNGDARGALLSLKRESPKPKKPQKPCYSFAVNEGASTSKEYPAFKEPQIPSRLTRRMRDKIASKTATRSSPVNTTAKKPVEKALKTLPPRSSSSTKVLPAAKQDEKVKSASKRTTPNNDTSTAQSSEDVANPTSAIPAAPKVDGEDLSLLEAAGRLMETEASVSVVEPVANNHENTRGSRSSSIAPLVYSDTEETDKLDNAVLLYTSNGIYQWLDDDRCLSPIENTQTAEPQTDPQWQIQQMRCTSEDLKTVQDVANQPKEKLDKRCKRCDHCRRVDKVIQISDLVRKPSRDVYDFVDDEAATTRHVSPMRLSEGLTRITFTRVNEEVHIYLEIFAEDSEQLIAIVPNPVLNVEKKIMRAGLVKKSMTLPSKDLELIANEDLLDTIVEVLKCSDVMKNKLELQKESQPHKSRFSRRQSAPEPAPNTEEPGPSNRPASARFCEVKKTYKARRLTEAKNQQENARAASESSNPPSQDARDTPQIAPEVPQTSNTPTTTQNPPQAARTELPKRQPQVSKKQTQEARDVAESSKKSSQGAKKQSQETGEVPGSSKKAQNRNPPKEPQEDSRPADEATEASGSKTLSHDARKTPLGSEVSETAHASVNGVEDESDIIILNWPEDATIELESDDEMEITEVPPNSHDAGVPVEDVEPIPRSVASAKLVEAPTFTPTPEEFTDPIAFFEKVTATAAKFGICRVVAPQGFKPKCVLTDDLKFNVTNQYIARMYSRWGPAAREMSAIKACLASQKVKFIKAPLLEGMELNLPLLYLVVQRNGGLNQVNEKKRWARVADEMRFPKNQPDKKLDGVYLKYLVPYETLSNQERQHIMGAVEKGWIKKNRKLMDWAMNPLHRQKKLLGESDSSEDETEDEPHVTDALTEAEDCVIKGRKMNLAAFRKVSTTAQMTFFPSDSVTVEQVEKEYWKLVLLGTDHVCVNAASIDTGDGGYGFSRGKSDPISRHPWNLKLLSQNLGNVLRSLGAVVGVTVPTLHLGMVFSTSCWHRDPHGLPWIEYMHEGPGKVWYGIPDEQSSNFRKAVETLCPTSCQNKSIWLPSDITMIPPNLLQEHNVSLSRVTQKPGEFIIVFPKAYSCSIATGYTVSESVYFATNSWLKTVHLVFQELRESCEPTTFSLEHLLMALACDPRVSLTVLQQVHASLSTIVREEQHNRRVLRGLNITTQVCNQKKRSAGAWNVREHDECEICRATLYLSMAIGLTGKQSSVCLQHAVRLIEQPKYADIDLSTLTVVEFFTEAELQEILVAVEERLAPTKYDTPSTSKSFVPSQM